VLAVVRDEQLMAPTSVADLRAGDDLLVLASPTAEADLRGLVDAAARPRAQP
jgi:NhaP-type Na+/H+ and K+/H+ antiporter